MSAAVRALEKAGAGFGDVRTEDRNAFVVRVANEQIQSVNEVHRRGWGLRAFVDGAWGYASGTSARSADAVQAARKAVAIARRGSAAGVPTSKLRKMPSTAITVEPKVRIEPRDVAGEEKVAAAMEVCRAQRRDGVANEAVEMLSAAKPPAGLMNVVTDPGVSGLLAHEVMGHASEGDEIVKKRSFLTDPVGKKDGSPLVSMYDDATYPGAHGSIPFD